VWSEGDRCGLIVSPDESEQFLTVMYEAYTWLTECLQDHGVAAPDPPSLESFLEGGLDSWDPCDAIGGELSVSEGVPLSPAIAQRLAPQADGPLQPSLLLPKIGITPSDLAELSK
jgi:hypothetical protein